MNILGYRALASVMGERLCLTYVVVFFHREDDHFCFLLQGCSHFWDRSSLELASLVPFELSLLPAV